MMINPKVTTQLKTIASQMVVSGKGLFAADETLKTIDKRFAPIHLENTKENRHNLREMFLTTPQMGKYISGVILFDETIRDTINGKSVVDLLRDNGVLPGIKVDQGLSPMPSSPTESITLGLEGLDQRLKEYKKLGALFCKWRGVFVVSPTTPTDENVLQNAKIFTQYALICQQNGLVPIVEPEILLDGTHSAQDAQQATKKVLTALFEELQKQSVLLEGLILKTSMVLKGKDCQDKETPDMVAKATIGLFKQILPPQLAGVVFLSGGQKEIQATQNLQAMHQVGALPWPLTFSYSRALEESAILKWQGKKENTQKAQIIFLHRAKMNSLASLGKYTPEMEQEHLR